MRREVSLRRILNGKWKSLIINILDNEYKSLLNRGFSFEERFPQNLTHKLSINLVGINNPINQYTGREGRLGSVSKLQKFCNRWLCLPSYMRVNIYNLDIVMMI